MFDPVKAKLFQAQKELKNAEAECEKKLSELEAIKNEIREKPELAMEVSEHAVVQFMDRALGYDINSIRTQILNLCDSAQDVDSQNRQMGMQFVHKGIEGPNSTSITMIVIANKIVTCYVNGRGQDDTTDNLKE